MSNRENSIQFSAAARRPPNRNTTDGSSRTTPFIIAPNVVPVGDSKGNVTAYMPDVKSILAPTTMDKESNFSCPPHHDNAKKLGKVCTQQSRIHMNPVHIALTKFGKLLVIAGSGNDDKGLYFRACVVDPSAEIIKKAAPPHNHSTKGVKSIRPCTSENGCDSSNLKHGSDCGCDCVRQHAVTKEYDFRSAITVQYNTHPPHPLIVGSPTDLYFNSDDMPPSVKGLGYDMFGSGFGSLESCDVLVVSGVEIYDIFKSTTRCAIWDPHTEEFKHTGTLKIGRWYPTSTTLPSGHIFTIGGLKGTKDSIRYNSTNNTNSDIYDPYAEDYDRGDNMIDPATGNYWKVYKTQEERMNGDGDTAPVKMFGHWMKHSLAELKGPFNQKGPDGIWKTNDGSQSLVAPGAFVPGPYQGYNISAQVFGSVKAKQDRQITYHGRGTEVHGAADGNNYDQVGKDYSPLHNDVFSPYSLKMRTAHELEGVPLQQISVAEDAEQPRVDMYPRQHLLRNGAVFISGMEKESWTYHPDLNVYDNHQDAHEKRIFGTSVLLPLHYDDPVESYRERVLILGGLPSYNRNIPASYTTEIIDLTRFPEQSRTLPKFARDEDGNLLWQQWRYGPSFKDALDASSLPRVKDDNGEMVQQNATILPDGTVFIQGGSRIDEIIPTGRLETFIYTPDRSTGVGTLKRTADVAVQRQYHGMSILLPDATVGIYGGNPLRGFNEKDIEIFEPPYLFNKNGERIPECERPEIKNLDGSPDVKMSGEDIRNYLTLKVRGLHSGAEVKVTLMRLGALTHAFNSEQRMVTTRVTSVDACNKKVVIEMPKFVFHGYNAPDYMETTFTPCPPGCYMVFVIVDGVPSHGKICRLIRSTGDIHNH